MNSAKLRRVELMRLRAAENVDVGVGGIGKVLATKDGQPLHHRMNRTKRLSNMHTAKANRSGLRHVMPFC
jgi:hypothetical protein